MEGKVGWGHLTGQTCRWEWRKKGWSRNQFCINLVYIEVCI